MKFPRPACAGRAAAAAVLLATLASTSLHAAQSHGPCRVAGLKNEVLCGSVKRPLDPARPDGVQIEIGYVVVPAMARRKLPDPVFLLAGGPGQSAIAAAPQTMALFSRLNNRRDLVFVDQRGTGRSAPLACDDDRREPLAEQFDPQRALRKLRDCLARLKTLPHGDLRFFTTTIAMQDLDAVRRQLGAERINLVGASYGTRAALEYLRQFPGNVRRAVIDGVAPPDMVLPASFSTDNQAAFDAVLAACAAAPACARNHPSLRENWAALLKSLPREVTLTHPLTGRPERVTLTRDMLAGAVRGPLYVPFMSAALPAAIEEAAQGRFDALFGLSTLLSSRKGMQLAAGMHFSVVCAEDFPRLAQASDPPGADFGRGFATLYEQLCPSWPRGDVPAAFYTVSPVAMPVLVTSGGLDPVTPPRHGQRVARLLGPSAQHVVVPNAGHGVLPVGCMRDVMFRFIDSPEDADAIAIDASCVKAIPRPPAFVPVAQAPDAAAEATK